MTIFIYDALFSNHNHLDHFECADRLSSIINYLKKNSLYSQLTEVSSREASLEELALVHSYSHINQIQSFCDKGNNWIDNDTYCVTDSFKVSCLATGGVLTAIDSINKGIDTTAFCAIRPPGHHATPNQSMGFCLFNHIAIAAKYIQANGFGNNILIIDWDAHHGNGTQEAFWKDNTITYVSSHRFPFYPGTGSKNERGEDKGHGYTFNYPIKFGTDINEIIPNIEDLIDSATQKSEPDWILISCGFDAYKNDPLGNIGFDLEHFSQLTLQVKKIADKYSHGKIVSILEGGYDISALGPLAESHLKYLIN